MGGFVSKWFFTVSRLVLKKEILDRDFFPDFPMLSMCFRGPQSLVETVGALPAQCGRTRVEMVEQNPQLASEDPERTQRPSGVIGSVWSKPASW